jgi:hypothetical protein
MNNAEKAILKAYINGVLTELLVKTSAEQVYLNDTTNLASKLTEMISAINERAKTNDMNTAISQAIDALRAEMLGTDAKEAYDTFTELAAYIASHGDITEALNAAIGNKADKSTVTEIQNVIGALGSLANKNAVSESDLDSALKEKVNAAAQGNHSHANKAVLDGITSALVDSWNGKSNVYKSTTQPTGMTANDLWIQLV